MKNIYTYILAGLLFLCALGTQAQTSWSTTNKWFTCQKGIDNSLSDYSENMTTIYYNDTLFNFIVYNNASGTEKVIVRKIFNTSTSTDSVNFDYKKFDDISALSNLAYTDWYAAPVVFNEGLYLFVTDKKGNAGYSVYNSSNGSWSTITELPLSSASFSNVLSAAVINDNLCLIGYASTSNEYIKLSIGWTQDLSTWNQAPLDLSGTFTFWNITSISTLSKQYMDNDTMRCKLMVGYLDGNQTARCDEFKFNNSGSLVKLAGNIVDTSGEVYSGITLAEGTVGQDTASKGDCVQAFLKKAVMDHNTQAYRIERFQKKAGGKWFLGEKNLVPLTNPKMWADEWLNPTATIFPVYASNTRINQFMCLFYRGYDGDNPLNCAWTKTDYLIYSQQSGIISLPSGSTSLYQDIGYIEGAPPYYHNGGTDTIFMNGTNPISQFSYTNSVSSTGSTGVDYSVDGSIGAKIACVKPAYKAMYAKQQEQDSSITISGMYQFGPTDKACYITLIPKISTFLYKVYDTKNNYIYPTYFLTLSTPLLWQENLPVFSCDTLVQDNPKSYMNRCLENLYPEKIAEFNHPYTTNELSSGSISGSVISSSSFTNKHKFSVGAEVWGIKAEGSIETSLTTSTQNVQTLSITSSLDLLPCKSVSAYPNDIQEINIATYWLKPTPNGAYNYWQRPKKNGPDNTWCITYEVNMIVYNNADTLMSVDDCQFDIPNNGSGLSDSVHITPGSITKTDGGYFLYQNYPNPVSSSSNLKYTIGKNHVVNSVDQGSQTKITVYNISGTEVAVLVNEQKQPGSYVATLDASRMPPGIYFYTMESGDFRCTKKLIVLK